MGLDEMEDVTMAPASDDEEGAHRKGVTEEIVEEIVEKEEKEEENGAEAEEKTALEDGDGDVKLEESASDSDSDDDDDDEEDEETLKEVAKLEMSVAANPYGYDGHVQLISTLRKAGLLEKLRVAREAMNALYPLTPTMWIEWAGDEARLAAGEKDLQAVEALYERGVNDYQSVVLWLDYLNFIEEHDTTVGEGVPEGVSKLRKLYERALGSVGLHFAEGGKVWEAYREFELALLMIVEDTGVERKVKQIETIRSLFQRQLTIPLADLTDTLKEYKEWEKQQGIHIGNEANDLAGLPPNVSSAYKKSLQLCSIRQLHEEKIARGKPGEAELLQHYLGYISIEEATGDPSRAQVLYERAISSFPVNQDVWIKYTQYLESNLKVPSVLRGVYARAVRNCPWVEPLWKSYLLALERFQSSDSEISAVFEQSLLGGFQTPQEYLDLFLTRCDGLRRRIMSSKESEDGPYIALLHDTFYRASQFLSTYYPDFVDQTLQLHAYWADVEVHLAKDMVAARGVWEGLIKSSGRMVEIWLGYIAMELSLRHIKEARSIYKMCYSRRLDGNGTELMCLAWLRFEREHGSLEDYDRAYLQVATRLAEVQSMQIQQESKSTQNFIDPRSTRGSTEVGIKAKEQLGGRVNSKANSSEAATGKRKRGLGFKEPKPVLKKTKVGKEEVIQKVPNVVPKPGQEKDKETSKISAGTSEKGVDKNRMRGEKPKRPKSPPRLYTDECTAFVSNVPFEVTEEQLREFFSSVAGVKEVRLLKEQSGHSRGRAYVDFEDEESLAAAITKDKAELAGRPLSVARSAPPHSRGGGRHAANGRGDPGHRGGWQGRGSEDGRGQGGSGRARGSGGIGHRRGGKVSMTGSNTFAIPRAVVRPLGWNPGQSSLEDDIPRSNDEFRKLLLSKK